MPPARSSDLFMLVSGSWLLHGDTRLLYVPTPPVFSYCTGIYMNRLDDEGRVEITARTENALMTTGCFFAAFQNGK